jgi:hypothetical protein
MLSEYRANSALPHCSIEQNLMGQPDVVTTKDPMYRIRIHSISANVPVNAVAEGVMPAFLSKRRNVFLDICAETGQITRY